MIRRRNSPTPKQFSRSSQAGFTIVELMIATAVFSMILLVIVYGVLSFTHAYYSGINASSTQDTARSAVNTIASSIEFSGAQIAPTPNMSDESAGSIITFCAGNMEYVYVWGQIFGGTPTSVDPGLYATPGCTGGSAPTVPISGGHELLSKNMRVTYLAVAQATAGTSLYTIQLGIAYGDGDLLCNRSRNGNSGGCLPGDSQNARTANVAGSGTSDPAGDVVCKQVTGSQFCAHASLSTTIALRVVSQ